MGASVDKIEAKNINFHERIGEGGFGTVKRVTFKKSYKGYKEAAAKSVVFELGEKEVKVMSELRHPNIVTLLGICQTGAADLILMEYAPKGSLHDYLKDPIYPLPYELQKKWAIESARAVQYLHQQNYLHRDIKPQNCLLFDHNVLKLCDFGLTREIEASQTTSSQKGTYHYMAPEIHVGNERGRGIYSKPSDIWSYGMLLLEICSRKPPFEDLEWHRVVFEVGGGAKPSIPGDCPKDLSDIMQRCWESDPKQRVSIDDILIALSPTEIHPEHDGRPLTQVARVACCPDGDIVVVNGNPYTFYLCSSDVKSKKLLSTTRYFCPSVCVSPLACLGYILIVGLGSTVDYVDVFNLKGDDLNRFSLSQSLQSCTIDKQGHLLACSQTRSGRMFITVHRCPGGELIKTIQCSPLQFVQSMFVNSKDQILIHSGQSSSEYSKVVGIDYSGNEVFCFTARIDENVTDTRVMSGGIVCDKHDKIYVAMKVKRKPNTGHVHAYSPTGEFLQCIVSGLYEPRDLSMTSDGNLLVANMESIVVLNPH